MNKTFSKALSVLLSIAMLLSMSSFSVFAQETDVIGETVEIVETETADETAEVQEIEETIEEETIINDTEEAPEEEAALSEEPEEEEVFLLGATDGLYVSHKNGNDEEGDGTEGNPYKTLGAAKAALGDLSKIYIVDAEYSITTGTKPDMLNWDRTAYTKTITYVGVDPDGKSAFISNGNNVYLDGPSKFENLTIVTNYAGTFDWRGFIAQSNDFTLDNVSFILVTSGTYNQDSQRADYNLIFPSQYGTWGTRTFTLANGTYGGMILGARDPGYYNTADSVTVNIENATVGSLDLSYIGEWGNNAHSTIKTPKLFVNLDGSTLTNGITHTSTTVTDTSVENLQILAVNGSEIPAISDAAASFIQNTWLVEVDGGELVATSTPGTLTVPTGSTAYWYEDAKTVKYATGKLTLEPGTHSVSVTEGNLADVLKAPAAPDGQTFLGWSDNGNGTLTAKYIVEVPGALYVSHKNGNDEEGDGTAANPYKTLGAARTALGSVDGKIAIVDSEYTVVKGTKPDMLMWETETAHTNKITYIGVDADGKSGIGLGGNLQTMGPVCFENLTIVTNYTANTSYDYFYGPGNAYNGFIYSLDNVRFIHVKNGTYTQDSQGDLYEKLGPSPYGWWGTSQFTFANGNYGIFRLSGALGGNVNATTATVDLDNATFGSIDLASGANFTKLTSWFVNLDNASSVTNGITLTGTGETSAVTNLQVLATNGSTAPVISDAVKNVTTNLWVVTADGALAATGTAGKFTIPAGSMVYEYEDDYTVKYVTGTLTLAAGTHTVNVAEGDITAILEEPEAPLGYEFTGWVDDTEGTVTATFKEVERNKHVLSATGSSVNAFEGTTTYNVENTTLHNLQVKKIYGSGKDDNFYSWSNLVDTNGKTIPISEARYVTINYFYESSDQTPALVGVSPKWSQSVTVDGTKTFTGNLDSSTYTGTAPKTYVANQWATITIDLAAKDTYAGFMLTNPTTLLGQYKFYPMGGVALGANDVLYIGDIWFTSHDPALELNGRNLVFVDAVNGNDDNNGSSPAYAVKTIDAAYGIITEDARIILCSDAVYDAAATVQANVQIASLDAANPVTITFTADTAAASNVTLSDIVVAGEVKVDGTALTVLGNAQASATATVTDGTLELYAGTWAVNVAGAEGDETANVIIDGATVDTVEVSGDITSAMITVYTDTVGQITGTGTAEALTVMADKKVTYTDTYAGTAAKKINITAPTPESSTGVPFSIVALDVTGTYATWSGNDLNYGGGNKTYTAYTYSPDGNAVYYSDADTGYVLTIPESGDYVMNIICENSYAQGGGTVQGFGLGILTLPEGALSWSDDGKGTITAVFEEEEETIDLTGALYVSHKNGNDEEGDGTAAKPYKTIAAAQAALNGANGKIAIVDAEYSVTQNWSTAPDMLIYDAVAHTNTITYIGVDPDGKSGMCVGGTTLTMKGHSHFKNLTIITGYTHNTAWNFINQTQNGGTNFSFENVKFIDTLPGGGTVNQDSEPMTNYGPMFISNSGFWNNITIGFAGGNYGTLLMTAQSNDANAGIENGGITVNAKDAVVEAIDLTSSTFKDFNNIGIYKNLFINLDNSTVTNGIIHSLTDKSSQIANVQILATNGSPEPTVSIDAATITNKWIVAVDGALTATSTAGTFTVDGGKLAKAVNDSTGDVVYSSGTTLTLPTGEWTVCFIDALIETDGTYIKANADTTINLADYDAAKVAGKTFIGWTYENGEAATAEVALAEGDKLVAKYIDFDGSVRADLSVIGAQIRNAAPQGLRYISQIDKDYLAQFGEDAEIGSVILPEDILGGKELLAETSYSYKGTDYESSLVPAEKIYKDEEAYKQFTVVLIKISTANYTRNYTVRSYIKFTDINGVTRYTYGNEYSTSIFEMAQYALEHSEGLSETAKNTCESIIATGIEVTDTAATYWLGSADSTEEEYAQGKVIYQTATGIEVREIHIEAGTNPNAKDATIGIVTDIHFNLINEEDYENAETMLTYQTRTFLKDGESIPNAVRSLKFASMFDQIAIPGDILDYLSCGAREATKEYIINPYPDVMMVPGNHDIIRNSQSGLSDVTTLESRYDFLREFWPHDLLYMSKVVNDNVMVIMLDNAYFTYWAEQVPNLEADLATARENGYSVVIIQHVPIGTKNEADTAVESFNIHGTGEDKAVNFYSDRTGGVMTVMNNEPSQQVYHLIRSNSDIIKAVVAGHQHSDYYTEIIATDSEGNAIDAVIPQHVVNASFWTTAGRTGTVTKLVFDVAEAE